MAGGDPGAVLERLAREREGLYAQVAAAVVETDGLSLAGMVQATLAAARSLGGGPSRLAAREGRP